MDSGKEFSKGIPHSFFCGILDSSSKTLFRNPDYPIWGDLFGIMGVSLHEY